MASHYPGYPTVTPSNGVVTVPCTYTYQQDNYHPQPVPSGFPQPVYSPPMALPPMPLPTYQAAYLMPGPQQPANNYPHIKPAQTKQSGQPMYISQVKVSRQTWSGHTISPGNHHENGEYDSHMIYKTRDTTLDGKPKCHREKLQKLMMKDKDYCVKRDRLYRTFSILFKVYGAMEATNEKIMNRFLHLRKEDRKFIMAHGDLESFLISSEYFEKDDGRVVLKYDVPLSTGLRYEVKEFVPKNEEVPISGQEIEEYQISEYAEHSRQYADNCVQYTADVHQFVGEDLYASSNQPYNEGEEFREQCIGNTQEVCMIGNGIVQRENSLKSVAAEDDNEEVECEEYNTMLDSSIEDWVNGIDLCEEPPCAGSEVIGGDTLTEMSNKENKVNGQMTFEEKVMENGITVQYGNTACAKGKILTNGISGDAKAEGTATIKENGHFNKDCSLGMESYDILSTHRDFNNAHLETGNPLLQDNHLLQDPADSFHSGSEDIHGSSNKNSIQDSSFKVLKKGIEIQQEDIWKENNVPIDEKEKVAESLHDNKAAAPKQKGKVCVQREINAAHSGQKPGKVVFDDRIVEATSLRNGVDEVDGALPQKTSSNKLLAQEIMESIFDMAYCKAKTNLTNVKGKSTSSGNWNTWSVQTDYEDDSSIYPATDNHLSTIVDSTQRTQAFCRSIVLDTISNSCNLAEKTSPTRSQTSAKKIVDASPSPLSKIDMSVQKLSPHAVEFTPSFNLERGVHSGCQKLTDAQPRYSSSYMDNLSVSQVSAVNFQPHPVECWDKKVPLCTKETQTGSHYNDVLKRAITAEKRVVKLQGQVLGMLLRQEFQGASFHSAAESSDNNSASFARLKQECKKIKTQVSFHASAIERGLSLEELPDMEVWLTLNGAQKNLTVDEDAEIVPSHEEVSLAVSQQNVERSEEKSKQLQCGLKSRVNGTEEYSESASRLPVPQVLKVEGKPSASADKNISSNVVQGEITLRVNGQTLANPGPSVEPEVTDALNEGTDQLVDSVHCMKSPQPGSESTQPQVGATSGNIQGVPSGLQSQPTDGQSSSALQSSAAGQTTSSIPTFSSSKRKAPVDVNYLMDEVKAKLLSRYPFLAGQPEVLASLVAQQTAILQYYMAQGVTNPSAGNTVNTATVRAATPPQAPPGLTSTDMVNKTTTSLASCMSTSALPNVAPSNAVTVDRRDMVSRQSSPEFTEAPSMKKPPGISSLPSSSSVPGLSNSVHLQNKPGNAKNNVPSSNSLGFQNQQRFMNVSPQLVPQSKPDNNEGQSVLAQPTYTLAEVVPRNTEVHPVTHQSPPPGTFDDVGDSLPSKNQAGKSEPQGTSAQALTRASSASTRKDTRRNTTYLSKSDSSSNHDNFRMQSSILTEPASQSFEDCVTPKPSSPAPGLAQSEGSKPVKEPPLPSSSSVPRQSSNTSIPEVIKSNQTDRRVESNISTNSPELAPNQEVLQPMENLSSVSEKVMKFPLLPPSAQPWMQQFQSYHYPASGQIAPRSMPPGWPRYSSPAAMNFQCCGSLPFQCMGSWRNPMYPQLPVFQNMPERNNGSSTWLPPNSQGSYLLPQRPNPHPGFSTYETQPSFPPESRMPQSKPVNMHGQGDSPVQQSDWPGLPHSQSHMSDPNPNVKNWRDCLDPKLPVFQKTKSDTAPQNPSGGNFYDEGTSGSQKEIWDDVEDFPELKVCGYNPKRELDYGTSTDKAEKSEAGTCNQVTNIPGLTGAMLDGMRRQVKRNTTAPGGGSANSQTISTTDWCSTSKKPPANQDSACEKSVQYKSTAADDTNPLLCGSSTRGAGGLNTIPMSGKRSVSSKAAAADETNPLLVARSEKDVGGLSSADGLTNIGLDEHPHPEDNEEEWTQVGKKKRKDTSSTAVPKSKKKGKVGVAASRPYIPGMNYAPRPAQQNKASNFERLLSILQQRFPQLNRPELIEVIQQVRSKKGSLTGLSMEQIVEECRPYSERKINMKSKSPFHKPASHDLTPISPTPTTSSDGCCATCFQTDYIHAHLHANDEEVDNCVICFDDLSLAPVKTLECGHQFHEKCIKCWVFTRERTCPTCRQHALFPEEFPKLGKD